MRGREDGSSARKEVENDYNKPDLIYCLNRLGVINFIDLTVIEWRKINFKTVLNTSK